MKSCISHYIKFELQPYSSKGTVVCPDVIEEQPVLPRVQSTLDEGKNWTICEKAHCIIYSQPQILDACNTANTRRLANGVLLLAQRRRRWIIINTALIEGVLFGWTGLGAYAITVRLSDVGLMMGQCRRRWPIIKPTSGQHFMLHRTMFTEAVCYFP